MHRSSVYQFSLTLISQLTESSVLCEYAERILTSSQIHRFLSDVDYTVCTQTSGLLITFKYLRSTSRRNSPETCFWNLMYLTEWQIQHILYCIIRNKCFCNHIHFGHLWGIFDWEVYLLELQTFLKTWIQSCLYQTVWFRPCV